MRWLIERYRDPERYEVYRLLGNARADDVDVTAVDLHYDRRHVCSTRSLWYACARVVLRPQLSVYIFIHQMEGS